MAVNYPSGPRLDHGLLLAFADLLIFGLFLLIRRRAGEGGPLCGIELGLWKEPFAAFFLIAWGIVRFFLDFFRAWDWFPSDARFIWLTPAQYAAAVSVAVGIWLLTRPKPSVLRRALGFIRAKLRL